MVLTDLLLGAAAKYLSKVDIDSNSSNQHEIGGLVKAGFKKHLEGASEHRVTMSYVVDEEEPITVDDTLTWYDAREHDPTRGPEFRLYYKDNAVTEQMNPGDFFLIAKLADGRLIIVAAPADSICEHELRALFEIPTDIASLHAAQPKNLGAGLPVRMVLESIGIEIPVEGDDTALEDMIARFGNSFPPTQTMSSYARSRVRCDPLTDPDIALVAWMEEEEKLFRLLERHLLIEVIEREMSRPSVDIDSFLSLSLSIHNRRKSRAGHAFENHLEKILEVWGIRFERGSSSKVTENKSKPDFLFPSFASYHDSAFPKEKLRMLGAKTTLKDRWRQVLAEAHKIDLKHLATLQTGISNAQFGEMISHRLQLVIPAEFIALFPDDQARHIMPLSQFLQELRALQAA